MRQGNYTDWTVQSELQSNQLRYYRKMKIVHEFEPHDYSMPC
jgi:hypothetical protein